ncbi:unnamed protein product, partial [Phaeothamnion confervicola]
LAATARSGKSKRFFPCRRLPASFHWELTCTPSWAAHPRVSSPYSHCPLHGELHCCSYSPYNLLSLLRYVGFAVVDCGAELIPSLQCFPSLRVRLVLMDVRQADYAGGNIAGALHIPFGEFDQSVADLAQEHGRGKTVVVNCMYSQQRGPSAAASLLRRIRSDCDHPGEESEVLVLRGGFHRWLNRWINDDEEAEALIEAYDPRMWKH